MYSHELCHRGERSNCLRIISRWDIFVQCIHLVSTTVHPYQINYMSFLCFISSIYICKIYAGCVMRLLGLSEIRYNCVFQIVTNPEKIHAIRYWDHIQMFPDRTRIISFYLCIWAHGRRGVQVFQIN